MLPPAHDCYDSSIEMAVAITVEGSNAKPETGRPPESSPEVTALVSPL